MASTSGKATQPTGACNGTAADFPNIEQELYDYQMHTKMCKKIAQLTKVIYSLNTKNEEQEAAFQSLRDGHHEELRRAMEEAKRYRSRAEEEEEEEEEEEDEEEGGDLELRRRLQALEGSLEEQLQLNADVQADFDAYRRQAEGELAECAAAVSEKTLEARRDTESRLEQLGKLTERLEREKETAEAELGRAREEARRMREELSRSTEEEQGRLEEACEDRTLELRGELEAFREESRRLAEGCRRTVSELKEAHREELEALRSGVAQRLQEQEEAQRASQRDRLAALGGELEVATQRLGESKRHHLKAQERIQDLEGQLEEGRRRVTGAELAEKKAEEELAVAKERLLLQENELLNKSEELLSQCSSQSKASVEVGELRAQVSHLQKQVKELEQQTSGKTSDHARQVKQHVEALSAHRQELQRAHSEELRHIQRQTEEDKGRLKEQLRKRLEEMTKKHASELRSAHASADAERKKAQRDLRTRVDELQRRSEEERRELEREKEELQRRLQESVCQGQDAPRSALGAHRPCGEPCDRLREELERAQCSGTRTREDLERLKERHQAEISAVKKERKILEDRILEQAQRHHEEKKRSESESESRQRELTEQHLSALARLQRDKDSEMKEMKESFQRKLKLGEKWIDSGTDVRNKGESFANKAREGLEQEMEKTARLSSSLRAQLHSTAKEKEQLLQHQDIKEVEESLWLQHEEVLRAEWHNHQQALCALEQQAQEELQAERHRQQAQQKLLLDRQKAELTQQHAEWCKQITQRHMQQIEDLQAELRTHTELVALQQDFKQQNQAQAFERQLEESCAEVAGLRRENGELKEQLTALHSQVESKVQELYRQQDQRCWEEGVKNRQHLEVENLKREHRKEIQTIVSDFSSAQTRLQARIVSLETELREKEEKSKRRESRIEDLQVIGILQDKLSERDQVIKRLVEERHHLHQHPLVASDSSALKTYENRPQPGSLTPTLRKKKMEDTPPRVTSVPNLSSYERSLLGPEAAGAGARSPQAVKSPSFEHGRSTPRTGTPTTPVPSPIPDPRQAGRYSRGSPSDDFHQSANCYSRPPRTPSEQRSLEPESEAHDPQRQEWFTKYFSF